MKKIIFILILIITWSATCLFFGYFSGKKLTDPVIIKEYETVWKDKIIYKNVSTMPTEEKDKELGHYYRDEFILKMKPLSEQNMYRIEGKLYEREAHKDIEIQCGESGGWKLYAGFGLAAAVGTVIYMKVR